MKANGSGYDSVASENPQGISEVGIKLCKFT